MTTMEPPSPNDDLPRRFKCYVNIDMGEYGSMICDYLIILPTLDIKTIVCAKCLYKYKYEELPENLEVFEYPKKSEKLSIDQIENSELMKKFGVLKKLYLYKKGFTIKSRNKNFVHGWNEIERVTFYFTGTTYNFFGHDYYFKINFYFYDSLEINDINENFQYISFPINLGQKRMREIVELLFILSRKHNFQCHSLY